MGMIEGKVVPGDGDPSRGRNDDARNAPDRGSLPGFVGPDQPQHLARGDPEGEPLDGRKVPIKLV